MSRGRRGGTIVLGLLSAVAGGLMTEGGVQEVLAYLPRGEYLPVALGTLGACASFALLASGAAFLARRPFGRALAIRGAAAAAAVHFAGWALGPIGMVGLLIGVVYPLVLLVLLHRSPDLGAAAGDAPTVPRESPGGRPLQRVISAA